ncbi:unnamed protein product [Spirodela intermedia]|uniref:Uncharacterized protein n=1 Tax=Spirodela intermedia TaxID=51605 RepID=A0A7I8L784_SPIIN|nr:unnamed protein product [Spirodela intermedia]
MPSTMALFATNHSPACCSGSVFQVPYPNCLLRYVPHNLFILFLKKLMIKPHVLHTWC